MHVHEVRFFSPAGLARAVTRLVDCPHVEGCVVDPDRLRLSFRAPAEHAAELIGRLHQRGERERWHFQKTALAS